MAEERDNILIADAVVQGLREMLNKQRGDAATGREAAEAAAEADDETIFQKVIDILNTPPPQMRAAGYGKEREKAADAPESETGGRERNSRRTVPDGMAPLEESKPQFTIGPDDDIQSLRAELRELKRALATREREHKTEMKELRRELKQSKGEQKRELKAAYKDDADEVGGDAAREAFREMRKEMRQMSRKIDQMHDEMRSLAKAGRKGGRGKRERDDD